MEPQVLHMVQEPYLHHSSARSASVERPAAGSLASLGAMSPRFPSIGLFSAPSASWVTGPFPGCSSVKYSRRAHALSDSLFFS